MSADVVERPEMADFLPASLPERSGEVAAEVAAAREQVESIEITNEEGARVALAFSQEINRRMKAIEAERVSLTKPRRDAAAEIKRVYDEMKAPYSEADAVIRGKISTWQKGEEEKAAEAQRLIDEERERVEAKARADREAAERAAKEAADLAAEANDEEDAAAAAELQAEAQRDAERAGVTEQAIGSLPAQAPVAAAKLSGFSRPKVLVAKVVDFDLLPDTLPDGTPLKVVDMVALRQWGLDQSKASGGEVPELPGAKFTREETGSGRVRT
jgi:hypothetical protein